MLCEPVCHRLSGRNQSKKKHACQADVLFVLCQGFWLFSVFRRSRLRGHRQIRRCDLHRSHRRGCRQSRRSCRPPPKPPPRLLPPKPPKFPLPKPPPRPLLPNPPKPNYPRNRPRAVSAAGAGGGCRRRSRRCAAAWVRPAEDGGRPNGADAGRAGDGAPRRWGDTSPSARPCRASCSGGDSGDNACRQA